MSTLLPISPRRPMVAGLLAIAACLASAQIPEALPESQQRQPNFGIYAAEFGGGVALTALGFACGGLLAFGVWGGNEDNAMAATATLLVAVPVLGLTGCAAGTSLAGEAFDQRGKFLPALGYGTASAGVGAGLCYAGMKLAYGGIFTDFETGKTIGWSVAALGIVALVATPVACVYGYNLGRPRSVLAARFIPGSLTLNRVRNPDGSWQPGVDVQLLGIRF